METSIDTNQVNDFMPEPARPQFLSALCILTWVCSGIIFIMTVWGAVFQPSPEEQLQQIEKIREVNPAAADQMEMALENQSASYKIINTLLTLVGLGLTTYGVWLMWNLKKKGLYLYIAGELVPYLSFAFGGAEAMGSMSAMTGMSKAALVGAMIGVMALFDGIFIAMYAANAKHMK